MSNFKLHYYQNAIVRALTTHPQGTNFNNLIVAGLESEHMNYHLKKLIELGLVIKHQEKYCLTDTGKDYSNMTDDEIKEIEKQPKTSILIWGIRKNTAGSEETLVNKRLRHPYYGKVGRITGKVRFGETFEAAAKRELYEETGLTARSLKLVGIYRKLRHRTSGEKVQDVIFYIFQARDFTGTLIHTTPYQENFWVTRDDIIKKRYDFQDDLAFDSIKIDPILSFFEQDGVAQGY